MFVRLELSLVRQLSIYRARHVQFKRPDSAGKKKLKHGATALVIRMKNPKVDENSKEMAGVLQPKSCVPDAKFSVETA